MGWGSSWPAEFYDGEKMDEKCEHTGSKAQARQSHSRRRTQSETSPAPATFASCAWSVQQRRKDLPSLAATIQTGCRTGKTREGHKKFHEGKTSKRQATQVRKREGLKQSCTYNVFADALNVVLELRGDGDDGGVLCAGSPDEVQDLVVLLAGLGLPHQINLVLEDDDG